MRRISTIILTALALSLPVEGAEFDSTARNLLLLADNKLEFDIRIGPDGLFGINVECALNGSAAEIVLKANEEGRRFPLWSDGFGTTVDLEFTSDGRTFTESGADTVLDAWAEVGKPFDLLDFLARAGSSLEVKITNAAGTVHTESFRSRSWKGLAALCGSDVGMASVAPVGRDRVLIDDIETAVDRYRAAGGN